MRLATYNLQNLRLRDRAGRPILDGAVDSDAAPGTQSLALDIADRQRTAQVIRDSAADVVALQEVFDLTALSFFHDNFLAPCGAAPYPHRICLPGNDGRGLNVAALSRRTPLRTRSHAHLTGADLGLSGLPAALRKGRIFRRDCLEVEFDAVSLFICHFKAPYPDVAKAHAVRHAEARAVRKIVETRFPDPASARWIVLGDFNEPASGGGGALTPLTEGFAVDLSLRAPPASGWTYALPGTLAHSRPDRILVSPRIAAEHPDARTRVLRRGMGTAERPHASDHALLLAEFPGL